MKIFFVLYHAMGNIFSTGPLKLSFIFRVVGPRPQHLQTPKQPNLKNQLNQLGVMKIQTWSI